MEGILLCYLNKYLISYVFKATSLLLLLCYWCLHPIVTAEWAVILARFLMGKILFICDFLVKWKTVRCYGSEHFQLLYQIFFQILVLITQFHPYDTKFFRRKQAWALLFMIVNFHMARLVGSKFFQLSKWSCSSKCGKAFYV